MTRLGLIVAPVVGVVAALLAVGVPPSWRLVLGGTVGLVGGVLLWRLQRVRVADLVDGMERRLPADHAPPAGTVDWKELVSTVGLLSDRLDELERRLAEQARWPRRMVDALVAPSLLFSADEQLVAANQAARELLGVDPEDHPTLIHAVGSATVVEAAREAWATGRRVTVDVELGDRQLTIRAAPVGEQLLITALDRTREREVQDLRRNFVVNASHELKTPAASIQALAEGLEVAVGDDPERARSLVGRLGEEAERLTKVVNGLLNLRRLEETAPPDRVPVDVAAIVREEVADLSDAAARRDLEVSLEVPEQAQVAGITDDVRLIARNLIANAIHYNRDGGRVAVSLAPRNGGYELTVADTGIGIPQQDLQRIFERFYRVDVARSRVGGGTGLGLSIVRHAVERQGGHIRVDSLLGEGSTFTVVLPVEPPG